MIALPSESREHVHPIQAERSADMTDQEFVYLDGVFVRRDEARISPFDRGFLFAHAAYEVTAVYGGKFVDIDHHEARLKRTLVGLEIDDPDLDFRAVHQALIEQNQVTEGLVYMQVTAGDQGPRDFYGPETLSPSVFMFSTAKALIGDIARDGLTAILKEDTRWKRRDLKTTQLLSQTLAYRAARRAGATTAILHEDGLITEAASANLWIVTEAGELVTRDLSHALLPGVTRQSVAALMRAQGVDVIERAFSIEELQHAKEAFTSSTGVVIAPVCELDGVPIGAGKPGPVTRQVQSIYYAHLGADVSSIDFL